MRVTILILGLLLAMSSATAQTLRHGITPQHQSDWLAVGRLNVMGQGFCTATLIAPDLVLTAAHCLVDRRTHRVVSADRINFLAGYRAGKYAAHGQGAEVVLIDGFSLPERTVSRDLAMVRLAQPLPESIRPLPVASGLESGDRLDVLSYAIDRAQLPSFQGACEVLRRSGPIVFTSCEGVPGVSGSPLIRPAKDGPRLVAVASSVASKRPLRHLRGNVVAIATDLELTEHLLDKMGRMEASISGF